MGRAMLMVLLAAARSEDPKPDFSNLAEVFSYEFDGDIYIEAANNSGNAYLILRESTTFTEFKMIQVAKVRYQTYKEYDLSSSDHISKRAPSQ